MTMRGYDDGHGHFDVAWECDGCGEREWQYSMPKGWVEGWNEETYCPICPVPSRDSAERD